MKVTDVGMADSKLVEAPGFTNYAVERGDHIFMPEAAVLNGLRHARSIKCHVDHR